MIDQQDDKKASHFLFLKNLLPKFASKLTKQIKRQLLTCFVIGKDNLFSATAYITFLSLYHICSY